MVYEDDIPYISDEFISYINNHYDMNEIYYVLSSMPNKSESYRLGYIAGILEVRKWLNYCNEVNKGR